MIQTTTIGKMESWFCWISLLVLLRSLGTHPVVPPHYTIHNSQVTFNQAAENCSPGILTTLVSKQDVAHILQLVSESMSPRHQSEFIFWIGLRKAKNQCVVPTLPLRGFRWTEGDSQDSQVSHWTEEPKNTCTTVLCAALKGQFNGSMVTSWGLISVTCKSRYQFICKLTDRGTTEKPSGYDKPATTEPTPANSETSPNPNPTPKKPEQAEPKPKLPAQAETDVKLKTGPDPGSEPGFGSEFCQRPLIPGARSITLDRDNSSRIQVQCWVADQLELHCSGHPAMWRLQDHSPANFSTICAPCEDGFHKDINGDCVDIDECSTSGTCRHTCLNTEGSFMCFCLDEAGTRHRENSSVCAGATATDMLIPLLVSVAMLVLVVVIVTVTVKCCLMKRSKKCTMKTVDNMAMKSKDSKDPTV